MKFMSDVTKVKPTAFVKKEVHNCILNKIQVGG